MTENALDYTPVPKETLETLHKNFMDKIESEADKALTQAEAAKTLLKPMAQVLLNAARAHIHLQASEIAQLAKDGLQALSQKAAELEQKYEPVNYTEKRRDTMLKAANDRLESEKARKAFNGEDRIYMKCDLSSSNWPEKEYVAAYLRQKGYKILDYKKGYATDEKGKQQFRIGKLLKDRPDLLQMFTDDPKRMSSEKLMVVISRNVDDIRRMSTNRSWTSCMNPDNTSWGAEYFDKHMKHEIKNGSLVAYLINEDDPEINNPLARITIKPYLRAHTVGLLMRAQDPDWCKKHPLRAAFGKAALAVKNMFFPEQADSIVYVPARVYGTELPAFMAVTKRFCEDKLNNGLRGKFKLAGGIYTESLQSRMTRRANGQTTMRY
jgi:hypothetical protein